MTDRWDNQPINFRGGLRLDMEKLFQGTNFPGTAQELQNYEPSVNGGYSRIKGFTKYSSTVVPGSGAILAVKPALNGVFAIRKTATDNALYYSTGTGWGSILNTTARTGSPTKARIFSYNIVEPAIVITDGVNPAGKWDGTNYVHLNSSGFPTAPKYAETYKDRLVLAPASASSSFILTAPVDDEDATAASGAVEIWVSDTIVGLKTFRDRLYIFCKKSIYSLEGDSTSNFLISDVTKEIGCLGHDTIQEIGGDVAYMSQSGVRTLGGTERFEDLELGIISKGIQTILSAYSNFTEDKYSSCAIPSKNQYRLFINQSTLATSSVTNFLGVLTDTPVDPKGVYEWAKIVGMNVYCAGSSYDNNTEISVFANASDGYVYRMESGNSFDGTDIAYLFRTPFITLGNATLRKVMQKMDLYTQISGDVDMRLNLIFDNQVSGVIQPPSIMLTQTGSISVYGTAIYDTSTYAAPLYPIFKKNLIGSGFTVAFQFSGSDSNPPHRLDSLDITFSGKGRR